MGLMYSDFDLEMSSTFWRQSIKYLISFVVHILVLWIWKSGEDLGAINQRAEDIKG